MGQFKSPILGLAMAAGLSLTAMVGSALAQDKVGVSWDKFQEERWKIDEKAIKEGLAKAGLQYVSTDAQGSAEKQIGDIDNLLNQGVKVLIVLARDKDAIMPAVKKAAAAKVPVLAYDRLIEDPSVFYLSFDNVEVGRLQAREVLKLKPKGNYVYIKGGPTDPNANLVWSGQQEVLKDAIGKGDIKIVGDQYTDDWKPEIALKNMEQILSSTQNKVDAVVVSNDGMAGGVVQALKAQGLSGIPVSGQDGDQSALNRVARGEQTVSVWKNSLELGKAAADIAAQLAKGKAVSDVAGATKFSGGPKKVTVNAILLKPVAVTRDNLNAVIEAGWSTKDNICRGVTANQPKVCM